MVGLPSSGPVGLEGAQWEAERGSRQPCHPATILQYKVYYPTMPSYYAKYTILQYKVYYPTMPSLLSYYAKSTILLCLVYYPTMPSLLSYYATYLLAHPKSTYYTIPCLHASDIQPIIYVLYPSLLY